MTVRRQRSTWITLTYRQLQEIISSSPCFPPFPGASPSFHHLPTMWTWFNTQSINSIPKNLWMMITCWITFCHLLIFCLPFSPFLWFSSDQNMCSLKPLSFDFVKLHYILQFSFSTLPLLMFFLFKRLEKLLKHILSTS